MRRLILLSLLAVVAIIAAACESGGSEPTPSEICGNGACGSGESSSTCPSDCGAPVTYCGDGTCQSNETCTTCASDCGSCAVQVVDSVEIGSPSDLLELYEDIGDVRETVTGAELSNTLQTFSVSTQFGATDVNQYLRFYDPVVEKINSGYITFDENENDVVGHHLFFDEFNVAFQYELEFENSFKSNFVGGTAVDFANKTLKMLGDKYTIQSVQYAGNKVEMILIRSDGVRIEFNDLDFPNNNVGADNLYISGISVADEQIEDAGVNINGAYDSASNTFKIYSIQYRLKADGIAGDVYISPMQTLSSQLDEPEGMLSDRWDIKGSGMTNPGVSIIIIDPRAGNKYNLRFTNRGGSDYDVGLFYQDTMGLRYNLMYKERSLPNIYSIGIGQEFVLTDDNDETGFTHILRYDSINRTNRLLTFTDLATGQVEARYDQPDPAGPYMGEIIVSGHHFKFELTDSSDVLAIDLDGDGAIGNGEANIVTNGGGIIDLEDIVFDGSTYAAYLKLRTVNAEFDENGPCNLGGDEELTFKVATGPSGLVASTASGGGKADCTLKMHAISGESIRQGLSPYGVFIEEAVAPQLNKIIMEYPLSQRGFRVFVEGYSN